MTDPSSVLAVPLSIDYTSRDYASLREDLIARVRQRVPEWSGTDASDFGVALIEAMAHLGDLLSYYNDRVAAESYISTAMRRESVIEHAKALGYRPSGYRSATVTVSATNTTASAVVLPRGTRVLASITGSNGTTLEPFETLAEVTIPAMSTLPVTFRHGETVYGEVIGVSAGTPNMTFRLLDSPVVDGSVSISVGSTIWSQVLHMIDFGPYDPAFTVNDNGAGLVTIQFGDGVSGAIPGLHQNIEATYVLGGGVSGNIPAGTIGSISFVPGLNDNQIMAINLALTLTNASAGTGGADPESTDAIRWAATQVGRAANRAVTVSDHAALARSVPGVGAASAEATDLFSVSLYVAPYRSVGSAEAYPGGTEGTSYEITNLTNAVASYLADKTMIGTSVSVLGPTYADVLVNLEVVCLPNYLQGEVSQKVMEAFLATFNYVYMEFNQTIYREDIEAILNQVEGVKVARINDIRHEHGGDPEWPTPDGKTLVSRPDVIWVFREDKTTMTLSGGVSL